MMTHTDETIADSSEQELIVPDTEPRRFLVAEGWRDPAHPHADYEAIAWLVERRWALTDYYTPIINAIEKAHHYDPTGMSAAEIVARELAYSEEVEPVRAAYGFAQGELDMAVIHAFGPHVSAERRTGPRQALVTLEGYRRWFAQHVENGLQRVVGDKAPEHTTLLEMPPRPEELWPPAADSPIYSTREYLVHGGNLYVEKLQLHRELDASLWESMKYYSTHLDTLRARQAVEAACDTDAGRQALAAINEAIADAEAALATAVGRVSERRALIDFWYSNYFIRAIAATRAEAELFPGTMPSLKRARIRPSMREALPSPLTLHMMAGAVRKASQQAASA